MGIEKIQKYETMASFLKYNIEWKKKLGQFTKITQKIKTIT